MQDKKRPNGFHLPLYMMVMEYEPTERYILWIISKDKTFMTPEFLDLVVRNTKGECVKPDHHFSKVLATLRALQRSHYIKSRKPPVLGYRITVKGQGYRFFSHPWFAGVGLTLAFAYFIIPRIFSECNLTSSQSKGTTVLADSVLKFEHPVQKKDSVSKVDSQPTLKGDSLPQNKDSGIKRK